MADETLGTLGVDITGDVSQLNDAIQQAQQAASSGADTIAAAFDRPDVGQPIAESIAAAGTAATGASTDFSALGDDVDSAAAIMSAFESDAAPVADTVSGLSDAASSAADSVSGLGDAGGTAAPQIKDVATSAGEAGERAKEASGGFSEMAEQLVAVGEALVVTEGLHEFGAEALTAFGHSQDLTIALTALSGSGREANEAVEQLKNTATEFAVPLSDLEATMQRLAPALLSNKVPLDQISESMGTISAASRVTGQDVESVGQSVERMALSTQLGARQLATLGISLDQLAAQLHTTADQLQGPDNIWKTLDPGTKLATLIGALQQYDDAAKQMAGDVTGQWQNLKNDTEKTFEEIGAALAPVITEILKFLRDDLVPAIKGAIEWFNSLPAPVKDVAVALGLIVGAAAPALAALGSFGVALSGLQTLLPAVTELVGGLGLSVAGLEAALIPLAPVVLAAGAAFVATEANIDSLKERYAEMDAELHTHQILDAINSGKTIAELQQMGFSMDQVKAAITGVSKQIDAATPSFTGLGLGIKIVNDAMSGLSANAQKYVDQQNKANAAVKDAKSAVDELTKAHAAGQVSQDAVNRAIGDYQKALDSVHPKLATVVSDVQQLVNLQEQAEQKAAQDKVVKVLTDYSTASQDWGNKLELVSTDLGTLDTATLQVAADNAVWNDSVSSSNDLLDALGTGLQNVGQVSQTVWNDMQDAGVATQQSLHDTADQLQSILNHLYDLQAEGFPINQADIDAVAEKLGQVAAKTDDVIGYMRTLASQATTSGELMAAAGLQGHDKMQQAADAVKILLDKMDLLIAAGESVNQQDYSALLQKWKDLQQAADDYGTSEDTVKTKGTDMCKQINDAITRDLAKSMTDLITGAGNVSDAFQKMGQDIMDLILNHIIKEAMQPLLDSLDSMISKFTGLFGGGGGSAVSGATGDEGGGSGGLGSLLGSGLSGWIGVGISAISGIVQGFQNAQMENTLNAIEESTRYVKIWTGEQSENILWSVQNTQGNTAGIWEAMGILEALTGRAAQANEYILGQIANVEVPLLARITVATESLSAALGPGAAASLSLDSSSSDLLARIAQASEYILGQVANVEVPLLGRITAATENTFSELRGDIASGLRNIATDILTSGGASHPATPSAAPVTPVAPPQNVQNALLQLTSPLSTVLGNIDTSVLTLEQMIASGQLGSTSVNTAITFTGPVVGGQQGMEELIDMVENALVDKLRQAGLKV